MATAVLRTRDPLEDRLRLAAFTAPPKAQRRRPPRPPPPRPAAPSRRSAPAKPSRRPPSMSPEKEKTKPRLVMEEVRILKRGEDLPPPPPPPPPPATAAARAEPDEGLCSTSRLGPPEPAVVPAKIAPVVPAKVGYAGPAYSAASPEPSSLPLPAFFLRKAEAEATRGLRCLLRIG